jgi:hypothetical protein
MTPAPAIEMRDTGTWLIVRAATAEDRQRSSRAVGDAMSRHGFSRTAVRLTSTSQQQLAALVRDPLGLVARYRSLVPLLVFFGGAGFAALGWFFRRRHPQPAWETGRLSPGRGLLAGAGQGTAMAPLLTDARRLGRRLLIVDDDRHVRGGTGVIAGDAPLTPAREGRLVERRYAGHARSSARSVSRHSAAVRPAVSSTIRPVVHS